MNKRRKMIFSLGAAVLAAPLVAFAQQQAKVFRIAYISPSRPGTVAINLSAFRDGMREHGLLEGAHYILDEKYAEGNYDRFPALTAEALRSNPAIIMVQTIASVRAAQQATKSVPIVFVSTNDPVGSGLVASLARPGGNTTGLSTQNEDTVSKYVGLLRELLPRAKHVAALVNASNPSGAKMFERVRTLASGVGISAKAFTVTSPESYDAAFRSIAQYRPDALMIMPDASITDQYHRISPFALKNRILTIANSSGFVTSGGLISYGAYTPDLYRRAATHVKKILAGAKAGDLPIEQPTKFELVINMKTAKLLGLKIPKWILVQADKVIE